MKVPSTLPETWKLLKIKRSYVNHLGFDCIFAIFQNKLLSVFFGGRENIKWFCSVFFFFLHYEDKIIHHSPKWKEPKCPSTDKIDKMYISIPWHVIIKRN